MTLIKDSMIKKSTLDLIGNTPIVNLNKIHNLGINIYGKLEYLQPGGSVKDRAALQIITDAYENDKLKTGQVVVEMTSGNMGAGLAVVCRQFGNPFVAVMPKGNSTERIKILRALGAKVILTNQVDGTPGMVTGKDIEFASKFARELAEEKNGFYVDQFYNKSGVKAHYMTTGPEILRDLPEIDAFIASIGSGGTFIGTSRYLKENKPLIKCIAVEPENAAVIKNGSVKDPKHIIQGTGYSLVPPHWENELADEIITVTDEDAISMTKRLSYDQGLFVGFSSGANVTAAIKFAEKSKSAKNILTILCDIGYKYSEI